MAESNVNIMLDTVSRNRINIIYAVENDYGARFITATIMTDGKKKAIERAAVVTINAERPDGQRKAFEGSVNEDGTVRVPVTQWMLEFEGEVVCSVSVVTSTSRLTTTHFYIQAQYSVWDGTSAPSADDPNKDVILEIIASENVRVSNEKARIGAENVRATAETSRANAEGTRTANEAIRIANEAERVSAESVRKTDFATWQGEIGKISAFDKRIENLEAAVSPGLVTPTVDDSVAYVKDVSTGALPNAMISEIGGMTYNVNGVLRDAKVTAVESVGVNLIPFSYKDASKTTNGITFTVNGDGTVTVNGTATELAEINIQYNVEKNTLFRKGTTYTVSDGVRDSSALNYYMYVNAVGSDGVEKTVMGTHTPTARSYTCDDDSFTGTVIRLVIVKGVTVSNLVFKPMLNRGEFALPYVQYKKHTLSIPEAVCALDGYGLGINATTYNRIDLEKKKFVKRVKRGTIDHVAPTQYIYNNIQYYASPKPTDFIGYGDVSDSFDVPGFRPMNYTTWDDASHIGSMSGKADYQDLWFGFPIGTTLEEAQSVLLGLPIVYELATPVENDLSNYFGEDNLIGVEGGGTVTMVNEYEYDVPSVIEYTVKGSDAV
jgi:hypothetical protein